MPQKGDWVMFFFLWVSFLIEKPWILRVFRKAPFYLEVFIEYLIFFFWPAIPLSSKTFYSSPPLLEMLHQKLCVKYTTSLFACFTLPFAVEIYAWAFIYHLCYYQAQHILLRLAIQRISSSHTPSPLIVQRMFLPGYSMAVTHCLLGVIFFSFFL